VPELPEVETVRRGLSTWVAGRRIRQVHVLHERAVRRHAAGPRDFEDRLVGRLVVAVQRRGKYLWMTLDDGQAVLAHLGMSGQLVLPASGQPRSAHLRMVIVFDDDDRALHFVDQRTFGGLQVGGMRAAGDGQRAVPSVIAHIAPDPLEACFDEAAVSARMRARRSGLKRALLDQSLLSGIGNIYADEALWRACLHYARPTNTLTRREVSRVLDSVREVLTEAVAAGGTSFDSLYVNVNGESGWFARDLHVYGRQGQPCTRCGSPIRRDAFMNRSSYSCPTCQRRPRRAHD